MDLPRLTIVLPNYNHAHFLPACLKALLGQSVTPLEVLALDDASKDNSLQVLEQYAREYPFLRVLPSERNQGVNRNVNRGIALAQGDYLFLTAADDMILPGFFEKSLRLLAQHPQAAFSCTMCEWRYVESGLSWHMGAGMAEQPTYLSPAELVRLGKRNKLLMSSSSILIRKDVLCTIGGLIPELEWHADWFTYSTAAFRHGICYVPEPLSIINILPKSHYTAGRRGPEHRQVLLNLLGRLTSPAFADVKPRIRECGALSLFELPMLKLLLAKPEYRSFINWVLLRRMLWRTAEVTGSRVLPRSVARWVLRRFYRHS